MSTPRVSLDAIFLDPVVRRRGLVGPTALDLNVEAVVGALCHRLIQDVTNTFELDEGNLDALTCRTRVYPPGKSLTHYVIGLV